MRYVDHRKPNIGEAHIQVGVKVIKKKCIMRFKKEKKNIFTFINIEQDFNVILEGIYLFFQTQWLVNAPIIYCMCMSMLGGWMYCSMGGWVCVCSCLGKNVKKQLLRVVLSFYLVKGWSLLFLPCSILKYFYFFYLFILLGGEFCICIWSPVFP